MKSLCFACVCADFRAGTTPQALHAGGRVFVIEKVPSLLCLRCREPQLEAGVADRLRCLAGEQNDATLKIPVKVVEYQAD